MDSEIVNITKIKDGFFLGDEATAANLDVIFQFKITHMINAAGPQILNAWENIGTKYLTLNWYESSTQNLFDPKDEIANRIVSFIDDSFKNGEGFLVHSVRSQNRACLVVLIYFIRKFRWSLKKALDFLRSKKSDIDIPSYFLNQLSNFEIRLTKIGEGPKSTNWNDLGTGLLTDIDNEELLIRNTYLNGNISSSIDDILTYKNFQLKKYTGRRLKWDDKNMSSTNKKDLLLQNIKEIKPVTIHLTMKPSKNLLKSGNNFKEKEKEEERREDRQLNNNYINKQFSNDKSLNSTNTPNVVSSGNKSIINSEGDMLKYKYETLNDYKNIYNNNTNTNSNIKDNATDSSADYRKQYLNHAYLRESSIKKKDTNNNQNMNMNMAVNVPSGNSQTNNKNVINSYSSYSYSPYANMTTTSSNFNSYYNNVNKNDSQNLNFNYSYDKTSGVGNIGNENTYQINNISKYEKLDRPENKALTSNIRTVSSNTVKNNNQSLNENNLTPIQRGHTPTKQIQVKQAEGLQKEIKRPSTADQKENKKQGINQKEDPKTYIIIAPTIQNVYNNVNQYINQQDSFASKETKPVLEKSAENQKTINNSYFNNNPNSNQLGNDLYFNLQNKKQAGISKGNSKNGFLNTPSSNNTSQYQYQQPSTNSGNVISVNSNSNPNSSFKRNSFIQRQGNSSQNGPVRIQSAYGNSKPLTPDVSVNKR